MSLQVSEAIIWQETAEGVSLYHTETGDFLSLNGTGAQIWALVASDGEREPVAAQLSLLYGGHNEVLRRQIHADVDAFITTMVESGLLAEQS